MNEQTDWIGWFDGACTGNGEENALTHIGVVLRYKGEVRAQISECAGAGTSNTAEWKALIALLEIAIEHKASPLTIHGDSQLVIKQIEGKYRVKKEHLKPLHQRALRLLIQLSGVKFAWIPREKNAIADALSKGLMIQDKDHKSPQSEQPRLIKREA